jgi:hypothetical protein
LPQGCYIQEFVRGIPGSVVFVASGGRAVPLGVSLQLVGEPEFGADGFRYCGSILAPRRNGPFSAELIDAACALASTAAREFGLVGVNGIDFVARGHVPYPVEVNPRWCSSVELVERAHRISVFSAHVATCTAGALPDGFDLRRQPGRAETLGKAVVFARHDIVTGDTRSWTDREDMSDIPHPGETIRAGRPVCTVFAAGEDSVRCRARLVDRAGQVYATLASWAEAQVRG